MTNITLEQLVASVDDIPALPSVTIQVIKLTEDPDSTAEDVNRVITQDQGLTAKVLRLANSAYYGFPRRIRTVTEATVLLGFQTIKSLALAASVSEVLNREVQGYALPAGELWRHSQAVAISCRMIARTVKFRNQEEAYTAGLLHDIGKVILNRHLQEAYQEVIDSVQKNGTSFIEAEEKILGFNHAQVGSRIAEKWNLPDGLVEAIACHHSPGAARINSTLTSIVHLADAMVMMMGIGLGVDGLDYSFEFSTLHALGLSDKSVEEMMARLSEILADESCFLL
ncbi:MULTISPECIES: HDOD domain-containing protein [Syntrophothermus]|nr:MULTISPECIES: HDOD domain-containing protein [Syntrophothermus]NSW83460.1 HDOD domain-containing protein [Syntrophothermus sp.]